MGISWSGGVFQVVFNAGDGVQQAEEEKEGRRPCAAVLIDAQGEDADANGVEQVDDEQGEAGEGLPQRFEVAQRTGQHIAAVMVAEG